ncbi:hypothetical protein FQR65_LT02166 [Abscondita terminalis]|nr:hypothetical protein FQR65_LT02166 [Abscondita terminalis]
MAKRIAILFHLYLQADSFTRTNFYVTKVENWDQRNNSRLYYNLHTIGNVQYLDFDVVLPIIDQHIGSHCLIESTIDDNHYLELFTIKEKYFCLAAKKYGGQFWNDLQTSMQLLPGTCPIPRQAFCFTRTNFVVKNVENCDKKNRSKLSFVVKTENGKQYTDFDVTLANALDETVRGTSVTESSLDGKSYLKLLQFSYKDPCKNANKYLGEFWYDALRACQLPLELALYQRSIMLLISS